MASRFFNVEPNGNRLDEAQQPRLALVIGNSAYVGGRLKNATADAELVADALRKLNFGVSLLVDGKKPEIEHALVDFGLKLRRAGRRAIGIFYFAGHGVQSGGQNYLIPIDANIPDTDYLPSGAVSVELLIDEFAKAPSAAKVIILDACRNDPIPNATRRTRNLQHGLASIRDVPDATLIVFSTASDTVASDGSGDNGPYAKALAKALTTPDRLLHEVMFDVSREVIEATDGVQRPALFIQGAMPAVKLVEGEAAPHVQPLPPPKPSPRVKTGYGVRGVLLNTSPRWRASLGVGGLLSAIVIVAGIYARTHSSTEQSLTNAASGPSSTPPIEHYSINTTASQTDRSNGAAGGRQAALADALPGDQSTRPLIVPPQSERRPTDPTRLALPVSVLRVANELNLSTEVAELIYLQSAVGLIEAKRYDETLPDLRSLAEAGQPIAQFWLGYLCYKGYGTSADTETALRWFKLAAEQGLPFAQEFAGTILMDSKRSASEQGLGSLWLNIAARQGYEPAIKALKRFKLRPNPNAPSLDTALKAFEANDGARVVSEAKVFVENHIGFAAYLSGRVLFEGRGIEADPVAGVEMLRQAARQQVGESMELLARAYSEGKGAARNPIEALAWARLAVRNTLDAGHAATLLPTAVRLRVAVSSADLDKLDKVLPAVAGEPPAP